MALQIRRGTNAERLSITPLDGELIFTTDTKEVFVGDGVTQGGKPVTAFSAENAQDFVAPMFIDGTHTGITFQYNDETNTINATGVNQLDDLIDVVLTGPVTPGQTLKYDGTSWINSADTAGLLSLEEDLAPTLGGDLSLNNFNVVGSNLTTLVNCSENSLNTSGLKIQFDRFTSSTGYFNFGNETSANKVVFNSNSASLDIEKFGLSNGAGSIGQRINIARGSLTSPASLQDGDSMYSDSYRGWDGTSWVAAAGMYVFSDPADTVSTGRIPGKIYLATSRNGGTTLSGISINSYGSVGINKTPLDTIDATLDVNGFAKLAVLTSEPTPIADGIVAIANGSSWNPLSNGKQSLVAYLGGTWVQIAVAP